MMTTVFATLRLIRWPNLLIIILTQYLIRHFLIEPMLPSADFTLQMSESLFALLVLSTVLLAAAGYIINDYFDQEIDQINKPDKIILDRLIPRQSAMTMYAVVNAAGLLAGGFVSWKIGNWQLVTIHLICAMGLWYYSSQFKNQFLVGNIVIALLAGLVPLVVGLFEIPLINVAYKDQFAQYGRISLMLLTFYWVLGFGVFAFLMTLAREITKDIEDIEGDERVGSETLPIRLGIPTSKYLIVGLYATTIALLLYIQHMWLHELRSLIPATYLLVVGIAFNAGYTLQAKTKTQFARASTLNKVMSLLGILATLAIYYSINNDL